MSLQSDIRNFIENTPPPTQIKMKRGRRTHEMKKNKKTQKKKKNKKIKKDKKKKEEKKN